MPSVAYDHQIFTLQEYGGISRYYCELALRINRMEGWNAQVLAPLHCNRYLNEWPVPAQSVYVSRRFVRAGRAFQAVNRLLEPLQLAALAADLVHRTYYGPDGRAGRRPLILTVFDMIHELFPAQFDPKHLEFRHKRNSVKQADHVLCISESTASDLMRLFDVPRDKISVVHLGFSPAFGAFAADNPDGAETIHGRPYILYVGQRAGYKNFAAVLRAYAASPSLRDAFDLRAFGGPPLSADEQLLIGELGLPLDSVRRVRGDDRTLAQAYRQARAFVYPSLYEGFGMPPLEAMSCGCPVACTNTSSLPEVVGDAAALFDPKDVEALRAALETVCFDHDERARLLAAGAQRVQRFSWDRCASETSEVYRRFLG